MVDVELDNNVIALARDALEDTPRVELRAGLRRCRHVEVLQLAHDPGRHRVPQLCGLERARLKGDDTLELGPNLPVAPREPLERGAIDGARRPSASAIQARAEIEEDEPAASALHRLYV